MVSTPTLCVNTAHPVRTGGWGGYDADTRYIFNPQQDRSKILVNVPTGGYNVNWYSTECQLGVRLLLVYVVVTLPFNLLMVAFKWA